MNGCPLDLAFNTQSEINIETKKKKKKTKNIVYPNEIKDYHSANIITKNELRSANEYMDLENKFVTTKSDYSKLSPYDMPNKYSEVNENKDDNFVKISNEEYQKYKEYQQKRLNYENYENYENNDISVINDNFNDTILFGLYGILFLFLIDNIYKLGKKSY